LGAGVPGQELLAPEQAEEHLTLRLGDLGMVLEARPFEVLRAVGLAVGRIDLVERRGNRQPLLCQPAVLLPVGEEARVHTLAGLGEAVDPGRRHGGTPCRVLRTQLLAAEEAEEDLVPGIGDLGVILEAGTLEVLRAVDLPIRGVRLIEDVGEGQPLLGQAAVRLPVAEERVAHLLPRLGEDLTGGRGHLCGRVLPDEHHTGGQQEQTEHHAPDQGTHSRTSDFSDAP
jgi:hypothetical protein